MPREHDEGPRSPAAVEGDAGDWTLVQPEDAGLSAKQEAKQEAAAPVTAAPSKIHAAKQDPNVPDVLTAKAKLESRATTAAPLSMVSCLLCLLEFAIKAGAALAQAACHAGEASARLSRKVAEHPLAASARTSAAQCTALLRQDDIRGAAGLACRHAGEAAGCVQAGASRDSHALDAAIFDSGAGAEPAAAEPVKGHDDGTSGSDQPTTPTTGSDQPTTPTTGSDQPTTPTTAPTDVTAPPTAPATPAPASTLRTRSAHLRRRVLAAAGSSYSAIDPEHKLAALAKKSAADFPVTKADLIAWLPYLLGGGMLISLALIVVGCWDL